MIDLDEAQVRRWDAYLSDMVGRMDPHTERMVMAAMVNTLSDYLAGVFRDDPKGLTGFLADLKGRVQELWRAG